MDEARRFLRYVLPGLVFGLQALLIFICLRPDTLPSIAASLPKESVLAVALAGLLASGAIGFLCSSLHHAVHWTHWGKSLDHSGNVQELITEKILQLQTCSRASPPSSQISREQAWILTSTLWYQRRETSMAIKGSDENARGLTDLVHTLGTARVAATLGLLVGAGVAGWISDFSSAGEALASGAMGLITASIVVYAFQSGYSRTAHLAGSVIDHVLRDVLINEKDKTGSPVRTCPAFLRNLPVQNKAP